MAQDVLKINCDQLPTPTTSICGCLQAIISFVFLGKKRSWAGMSALFRKFSFDRHRDTKNSHPLVCSPIAFNGQGWSWGPGTQCRLPTLCGRNPMTWAITAVRQQEDGIRGSQDSNLGTLNGDRGIPSSVLMATPNACPKGNQPMKDKFHSLKIFFSRIYLTAVLEFIFF